MFAAVDRRRHRAARRLERARAAPRRSAARRGPSRSNDTRIGVTPAALAKNATKRWQPRRPRAGQQLRAHRRARTPRSCSGSPTGGAPVDLEQLRAVAAPRQHAADQLGAVEPVRRRVPPAARLHARGDHRGRHDAYIRSWARDLKRFGNPVFLRFAQEMNGNWYPWAEDANGNKPGEYARMWRHVHDIFTAEGATNVKWVWCPVTRPVRYSPVPRRRLRRRRRAVGLQRRQGAAVGRLAHLPRRSSTTSSSRCGGWRRQARPDQRDGHRRAGRRQGARGSATCSPTSSTHRWIRSVHLVRPQEAGRLARRDVEARPPRVRRRRRVAQVQEAMKRRTSDASASSAAATARLSFAKGSMVTSPPASRHVAAARPRTSANGRKSPPTVTLP